MTSNTASSLLVDPSVASRTQNSELRAVSGTSQTRSLGAIASAQYGYDDRYLLNVSLRGNIEIKTNDQVFFPNGLCPYGYFPTLVVHCTYIHENIVESRIGSDL